jgi:hypothetical protein
MWKLIVSCPGFVCLSIGQQFTHSWGLNQIVVVPKQPTIPSFLADANFVKLLSSL